ncbi:class I SAM-dependent methyltransferase [Clostridium sp. Cult2]|uniref:class I SAM-dependent methyltransferase n=1 Tax=Clostridium sp. Cult2 TaxID=2079003 RepID=UPI001F33D0E5|nr:class I SAM-dependent methyltransferase [Clostridium sp. Cult2]MCF6464805.1 class I SAM-dependent methyltransferase [Clostridium sp. Cult2]
MITYYRNTKYWNNVFSKADVSPITSKGIGHGDLDKALDWLCQDSNSILDFGCGNGVWLFKCYLRGTKVHRGIDIAEEGIKIAREIQKVSKKENFIFTVGGVETLESIPNDSFDGVILSNIIDNLIPSDAIKALSEVKRILKIDGKVLIKLNPFLTDEQIKEWDIKIIEKNFLDDGLFLWNQTTEEWTKLLGSYFSIVKYKDIYYPEHEQYNRLFLLCNDKKGEKL